MKCLPTLVEMPAWGSLGHAVGATQVDRSGVWGWPGRRSNKSILKEISPEYSLEGLMLKLKLQYFGHLM